MTDTVYIVQSCFGAEVEKTVGPFTDGQVAHHVTDAIERHFYNDGDQYCRVEERTVIE